MAVAAACLAASLAGAADAEPFEDFVTFCVRTNAEQARAAAAATNAGWISFPAELLGDNQPFEDTKLYLSHDPAAFGSKGPPSGFNMLVFGTATSETLDFKGAKIDGCGVGGGDESANDLRLRISALLGFEAAEVGQTRMWLFSRLGDGFKSENATFENATEPEIREAVRRGKIYAAGVSEEGGEVVMIMAALKPE